MKTNSETWLQAIGRESSKALGLFSLSMGLGLLTCLPLSAQHRAGTPQHRTTTQAATPPKAVDMGLSVKWCDRNLGAASPKAGGGYYGWGDASGEKTSLDNNDYKSPMKNISGTNYDVVKAKWGGKWRIPTETECKELIQHCYWHLMLQNGKPVGLKAVAENDNSICFYFPKIALKGARNVVNPHEGGFLLYLWTSNMSEEEEKAVVAGFCSLKLNGNQRYEISSFIRQHGGNYSSFAKEIMLNAYMNEMNSSSESKFVGIDPKGTYCAMSMFANLDLFAHALIRPVMDYEEAKPAAGSSNSDE